MKARNVDEMRGIPFTQYLLPDGRQAPVWIVRTPEVHKKAQEIIDALFQFECEMLTTNECHLTISDDFGDYAHEIVLNGPNVPDAVDRLVNNFDITAALEQRKQNV